MTDKSYEHSLRVSKYIMNMRPVFNEKALFSDETENYVSPMEPEPGEEVTIRVRTEENNVDAVYLISGKRRELLEHEKTENGFDFYRIRIRMGKSSFRYYFEVKCGKLHCFFNKLGVTNNLSDTHAFTICPGFHTPAWAKGAVMYQLLVDRFWNGNTANDVLDNEYSYIGEGVRRVTDWSKRPDAMGVREFYGGDLDGVLQKLDYLQDLGIEVIYFNPLFVSPSNHKYDIQDYDHIDPHLGRFVVDEGDLLGRDETDNAKASRYINRVTRQENLDSANAMFIKLVEECHRRGIRVILDGVFNHCGSFNKWMDRERIYEKQEGYEPGAFISADSPYRSFFHFMNEHEWPYNPYYEGWWDFETLPKLNYEGSEKLEEYILSIARKWVSPPFNADGWRLDVAADLGHSAEYNHRFWKRFRQEVKSANPEAIILAEHYGGASAWLGGDEWDSVMNYDAFMEPLTWFFTGMEKHSDRFEEGLLGNAESFVNAMRYHMSEYMAPSLQTSMNELSNHDHSRFLTRTNHIAGRMTGFDYDAASDQVNPAVMREAVVMQMTWPGAPTLYYGDEAGVCGFTDPDNRRTYPWGREDQQMLAFHRSAIRMHKEWPVLTHGSLVFLHTDYQVLSYGRFSSKDQMVVIFNNNAEAKELEIRVWPAQIPRNGRLRLIFAADEKGFWSEAEGMCPFDREEWLPDQLPVRMSGPSPIYSIRAGILKIVLPGTSAAVLVHSTNNSQHQK